MKNFSITGWNNIRDFYAATYEAIPTFRIQLVRATCYTPEFTTVEMTCEGEAGKDLPAVGMKAGDTMRLVGVSLFWWRWEGKGSEWGGGLDDETVRGWKIVEEQAYFSPQPPSG